MDLQRELIETFLIFDSKLSDAVLTKCKELCSVYNISPEDLANQWAAYSITNLNGDPPTVQGLLSMEHKELSKSQRDVSYSKTVSTPKSSMQEDEIAEVTDNYGITSTSTPKSSRSVKRICSPIERNSKRFQSNDVTLSPQLLQTTAVNVDSSLHTQPSDYAERTDSGTVILSYGQQHLLHRAGFRCEDKDIQLLFIGKSLEGHLPLSSSTHYMYEIMRSKANSLNSMTENLGQYLLGKFALGKPTPVTKSPGSIITYGRICCDWDGKLNAASVLLESSMELGRGVTIPLNLSKLQSYSIFPGQVVAVKGFNSTGNNFVVQNLYTDASPNMALPPEHTITLTEPLHVVVAAAPFTLHDNLQYQPLQDLVKTIVNNRPHVVILVGPFIDETHQMVSSEDGISETYNTFFEGLVDCIMSPLEGSNTQVVLVASQKDVHHYPVYPTPPYIIKKKYPNLHCVADPSLLNIQGLIIGVTSVDILLHLGKEEFSLSPGTERMIRLVSNLFNQQCFYPLYPPDDDVSVDHELLEQHGILDVIPHILLVPSNLRYFIKNINGCTVINPERLTKGYIGGTYVQIQVFPPKENELLNNNIIAKVVRI